jgi:hypothetical protein
MPTAFQAAPQPHRGAKALGQERAQIRAPVPVFHRSGVDLSIPFIGRISRSNVPKPEARELIHAIWETFFAFYASCR